MIYIKITYDLLSSLYVYNISCTLFFTVVLFIVSARMLRLLFKQMQDLRIVLLLLLLLITDFS